jgi:Fe-S oxidoreductase/coenzyme F420-reducing hydrogenase delta subunit
MEHTIILYLCTWGPHAAFQTLMDTRAGIPHEIKMVRVPCAGRVGRSLLFKPFEMGASGVAVAGCKEGACRYGMGACAARDNVADTREILGLLGLSKDRLAHATFGPEEDRGLASFLTAFAERIRELGPSPIVFRPEPRATGSFEEHIRKAAAAHDLNVCQDCGKCASACPVAIAGKPFSPRAIAQAVISGRAGDPAVARDIWTCLTCGTCQTLCPSAVNFPDFVRDARHALFLSGNTGQESHGGFFQSLSRAMCSPDLPVRHWDWLPEDIRTDRTSKTLFFGGCAPYFDVFFRRPLGVRLTHILADGLRLLNFFDITPAVLDDERCCGHDLLWSGDKEGFLALARLNTERIHAMGVEEVITACPEGYRTLSRDYPAMGIERRFKVTHLLDALEREIGKGAVAFERLERNITFQDPCRLSRHEGRPDLPRALLSRLDVAGMREMRDRGANALCCGNCAWTGCGAHSKAMQTERLRQAREAGADLLVTACPKCQIHLACAMRDPFMEDSAKVEIQDITGVLAKTIRWA